MAETVKDEPVVRHSGKWWVVAGAGALLLACAPFLVADQLLRSYVERQAQTRLDALATSALGLVETRLEQATTMLVDLAALRADQCGPDALAAMRRAVFASSPLKELSVFDANGRTLCTQFGAFVEERMLSRELNLSSRRLSLAMVRFRDRSERAVQLRLERAGGGSIAALVPGDSLLPEASQEEMNGSRRLRLALDGGDVIAARPGGEEGGSFDEDGSLTARRHSERFPISVDAERVRGTIAEEYRDILLIGRLGTILVTVFALIFVWASIRRDRSNPVAELRRAIADGEIVPFYQPLVDIKSGRIHGAEVLARWRRSDGALVPPARFIPLAEESSLIYDMTRALMRRARDEMSALYGVRPEVKIGFNLFAGHFSNGRIVADVKEIFGGSPIAFDQIVLEVTERSPLADLAEARQVIAALQEIGCQVGIDDVGTGHGGLSYLLKLGVDLIKIDKMFVDALGSERYSQTIIETLAELARTMNIEVVAEGVETFEQVEYLRAKDIQVAQGYVFAPPLPGSSYAALLEAMEKPRPAAAPVPLFAKHAG
ncbi:MAG TPA: EAL domain-containing protein [Xanthobacteraceae bacterium]|nr:EAL domain-containing protein [Xanthobacteraceae bacterium]